MNEQCSVQDFGAGELVLNDHDMNRRLSQLCSSKGIVAQWLSAYKTEHCHVTAIAWMVMPFMLRFCTLSWRRIRPKTGRAVIYTAGLEALHSARRITWGTRYVLGLWFTCNPEQATRGCLPVKRESLGT
eukprot:6093939-Amphidinium_carterae.1